MPRAPRIRGEQVSYHIIARCNNEEFLFQSASDFSLYLECLRQTQTKYKFEVNNFTLMSNHVHLIVTTRHGSSIDKIIHQTHLAFTKLYNRRTGRKGHFWRDRYKSPVIEDDAYGLACMRYINRNPLRAGMVKKPEDWPWSAYRFYAFGEPMSLVTPFPSYMALSRNQTDRRRIYRGLVETETGREKDEKRIFSGKLNLASRRSLRLFNKTFGHLVTTW